MQNELQNKNFASNERTCHFQQAPSINEQLNTEHIQHILESSSVYELEKNFQLIYAAIEYS